MSKRIRRDGKVVAIAADEPGPGDRIASGTLDGVDPRDWQPGDEELVPVPFVADCSWCDRQAPENLEKAKAEGWTDFVFDPLAGSWNYLGTCPACAAEEAAQLDGTAATGREER